MFNPVLDEKKGLGRDGEPEVPVLFALAQFVHPPQSI
jgi:hypothetical protein